eukprot:COSAG02_NODE_217_length_28595_cov_19.642371_33_plen_105_part_00
MLLCSAIAGHNLGGVAKAEWADDTHLEVLGSHEFSRQNGDATTLSTCLDVRANGTWVLGSTGSEDGSISAMETHNRGQDILIVSWASRTSLLAIIASRHSRSSF